MTNSAPSPAETGQNEADKAAESETVTASGAQAAISKSAGGDATPHANWFDKVFSRGFTPEDLVLYLLSMLLIIVFWSIFRELQAREDRLIASISAEVANAWGPGAMQEPQGSVAGLDDDEWINMQHIGAQLTLSAMRYQQGSISTAAISTRKNLAFLAGVILAIIGCVIIIRGVRQSQTKFDAKVSERTRVTLLTTSPGIFVVLMGAIIVVAAVVTSGERPEIEDAGIQCHRCGVIVLGANELLQQIDTTTTPTVAQTRAPAGSESGFPAIQRTPTPEDATATPDP